MRDDEGDSGSVPARLSPERYGDFSELAQLLDAAQADAARQAELQSVP